MALFIITVPIITIFNERGRKENKMKRLRQMSVSLFALAIQIIWSFDRRLYHSNKEG